MPFNLTGKHKNGAEKATEKVPDLPRLARIKQKKKEWWERDTHTQEMHSKLSRQLKESTLIKMLTETLSIYERGLTLRKKKQHSAGAAVTICQVLSRCTQSHRHIACTYAHSLPHMSPLLLQFFFFFWCFCDFSCFSYYIILFYHKIQLSHLLWERKKKYLRRIEAFMSKTIVIHFSGLHLFCLITPI